MCDFLIKRSQRVKLSDDWYSEWAHVPSGVPKGTKLGPWLLLLMINDLKPSRVTSWKYVDDTTLAEIVNKGAQSHVQNDVDEVQDWTVDNKLQLNADKCKELIIDFKTVKDSFDPIAINGKELELVNHAKILGVTISSNFLWNEHVSSTIKKANKRLYFLVLLRRAKVPSSDIVSFYCTCIRPVLEYCSPVFHNALPEYLSNDLEQVQKRALSIISPGKNYSDNLESFNMVSLLDRRIELCNRLFKSMENESHKLHYLLHPKYNSLYNLRRKRDYKLPLIRTNRTMNTFINAMSRSQSC